MGSSIKMVSLQTLLLIISLLGSSSSLPSFLFSSKTRCRQTVKVITPRIAQNLNGQLKFINQENSTHSDYQRVTILVCREPGSSCRSCSDQDAPDKLCQQSHGLIELWVLGDNGKDLVEDKFLMPDGCSCVSTK